MDKPISESDAMSQLLEHLRKVGRVVVFVSSESAIADFSLSATELRTLSDAIGFPVSDEDYLKDVAWRIARPN